MFHQWQCSLLLRIWPLEKCEPDAASGSPTAGCVSLSAHSAWKGDAGGVMRAALADVSVMVRGQLTL